jgi:hypothetical protein
MPPKFAMISDRSRAPDFVDDPTGYSGPQAQRGFVAWSACPSSPPP